MPPSSENVTHYALVARTNEADAMGGVVRRRYSLSRLGASPRSALGENRLERMERIADSDGAPKRRSERR